MAPSWRYSDTVEIFSCGTQLRHRPWHDCHDLIYLTRDERKECYSQRLIASISIPKARRVPHPWPLRNPVIMTFSSVTAQDGSMATYPSRPGPRCDHPYDFSGQPATDWGRSTRAAQWNDRLLAGHAVRRISWHFRPIFRIRANTSSPKVLVNYRTHWLGSGLPNVQMAMQLSVSTGTNPKLQIRKCVGQERSSCPLASFLKRWDQCVLGNGDEQKRPNHRAWGGIICSAWIAETVPHR